ncbi:MAG TPA: ornithine cyclodeaminase family protein [Candidatus Binataceae bacterium]|nr:ornithine cyclodeaminase family protein [Candidatus Binataceae bacterium]
MTLILTSEDVEKLLTMELCMEALEYAYAELGRDNAVMGPVIRVIAPLDDVPKRENRAFYAYSGMAAALPGWDVAANRQDSDLLDYRDTPSGERLVRIPASPGGRFCGFVLLHRVTTGELLAVIQDGFLQKTRVGGLAGVAAKYLARRDASVLAVLGSGWQASAQVEAHCRARPIREVRVFSPTPTRREAFAAEMALRVQARVTAVASAEAAVRGAHIVATATNSIEPVLRAAWLEPGMFITSVKEVEFEPAVYERCELLVCNRRGPMWQRYVVGGAESIPEHGREIWYRWNEEQWRAVRYLGRIVAGRESGRTSDDQVIAFMNQGEGLQFAAVGRRLYDLARERGIGVNAPLEWFHQDKKYIP